MNVYISTSLYVTGPGKTGLVVTGKSFQERQNNILHKTRYWYLVLDIPFLRFLTKFQLPRSLVAADMMQSLHGCKFIANSVNGDLQITRFVLAGILVLAGSKIVMAARNRVVAALNFLTGEGVDYYSYNCNKNDIGALISDYFKSNGNDESDGSDCESPDESACNNEGAK